MPSNLHNTHHIQLLICLPYFKSLPSYCQHSKKEETEQTFLQHGFDYTQSDKHIVAAYEKYWTLWKVKYSLSDGYM